MAYSSIKKNEVTMDVQKIFKLISEVSEKINIPAYVVGGFVRDEFLQKENKDVDIVVVGSGIEFSKSYR